ncbi:hypothetical protein E1176_07325 [Fulvivirga sp. RKSG066]|uniref:hypothetical protein n=1 Tax=Fulvivirga aurantia TaxID=2529383 RepID=UPI0012BBBCE8|nr:hypothetical protein [Fulvivirga aurantia]MTI20826.1 hypothetical protein [Fulvivirga aurantia]
MANAEQLTLSNFVSSFTDGNTVESACVDESLTGKCIDYHNDQWFYFNSGNQNRLYVNIFDQKCRDMRGVQLVVLQGELCDPTTYQILNCTSLATQDDIFIEVDVEPNQYYWLNVDGYLHDYCEFFIEVSPAPRGISKNLYPLDSVKLNGRENIFAISWRIPDSLSHTVLSTQILRKTIADFKYDSISTRTVKYNAFGDMTNRYAFSDTLLRPGNYQYRLALALNDGKKLFAGDYDFKTPVLYNVDHQSIISIPLDYRRGSHLRLNIRDAYSREMLNSIEINFDPKKHSPYLLFKNKYAKYKGLEVEVINLDMNHTKSYFFNLE